MARGTEFDLTILGGGITGLAAAYIAARQGLKTRVLEGAPEFGGLLNTFEIAGTRLEYYYHHFFTHDVELRWLLEELELSHRLIFRDSSMGIYRDGRIYPFDSPFDLLKFKPLGLIDKARFAFSSLYLAHFADWRDWEGIPASEWLRRYAGRAAADAIWDPMLKIKFGPFAKEVPASWMVGRLRQRLHSRSNQDERLGYLDGSLKVLLDQLLERLEELGVELISGAPVERLGMKGGRVSAVVTPKGIFEAQNVLATIPGVYLEGLVEEHSPELAEQLRSIEYFGAICVVLQLECPLSQIYWLNVADQGFPFGGIIEHTNLVPSEHYEGKHLAYLSRYFAHSDPIARVSEKELRDLMLKGVEAIFPEFERRSLSAVHVFRSNTAATVCNRNFSRRVPSCQTELEGLFIANMSHVYPDERSCNNSIRVAAQALSVIGVDASVVPAGSSLAGQIGMS